jgi:short-subunit dehydrogenase
VVVITGAGAGLGRATARIFGRRGARVGLIGRDRARLDQAAGEIRSLGGEALALTCDVADAQGVETAAAAVEQRLGAIDVWVNNAMATIFSPFCQIAAEDYRRATEVTYLGAVHGTMAALRRMRPRDRGTIVQVGSALAYRAIPLQSPYCGAKFAIRGFTDALRSELIHEHSRVRVTMVQMPALNTPQFDWARNHMPRRPQPVPPIFDPETGARAIAWAVDHPRREVYVGVPTLKAIWANKLFPGLLDHYLARMCYEAQESPQPAPADHPDNLWQPVEGDYAAHGRFDARAQAGRAQTWATLHRGPIALTALALAAACLIGSSLRKQGSGDVA